MHPTHMFKFQCVHQFDGKRRLHRARIDQCVAVNVLPLLILG